MKRERPLVKFEEGSYEDIDSKTYLYDWNFVSSSVIKELLKSSPAKVYDGFINKKPSTPAQEFGSTYHDIIENKNLDEKIAVGPMCSAVQGNGRRCSHLASILYRGTTWYCRKHSGRGIVHEGPRVVRPEDYAKIMLMAERTRSHPEVGPIINFKNTKQEISMMAEVFGLRMKARFDCLLLDPNPENSIIVDFKTCVDNSPRNFRNSAWNFGYWHQAFIYLSIANKVFGEGSVSKYAISAIEKEPPFSIAYYELKKEDIELAGDELLAKDGPVETWKQCITDEHFPDYPRKMYLNIPTYITKRKGDKYATIQNISY